MSECPDSQLSYWVLVATVRAVPGWSVIRGLGQSAAVQSRRVLLSWGIVCRAVQGGQQAFPLALISESRQWTLRDSAQAGRA